MGCRMFAVLERASEYDDNRYTPGQGWDAPTRIYKSRAKAEEVLFNKERTFFIDTNLFDYYEEPYYIFDEREYEKFFVRNADAIIVHHEIEIPHDFKKWDYDVCKKLMALFSVMTDEEWKKFHPVIRESHFMLVEVDIED